jgi:hypothetical protein
LLRRRPLLLDQAAEHPQLQRVEGVNHHLGSLEAATIAS